jgi:glycosyltransferase involved in cell wall biosynthesis
MKVMVLGIRGLPNVPGGVETHAEQLYQRLARLGCEIEVLVRSPFVPATVREFAGMKLRRLWAPRRQGFEALLHSVLGVLYAAVARPDLLHVHAIGPAIVTPLARLFGLRVLVTHHGADYERDKWGRLARAVLRTGERLGMRYANARIAISETIARSVKGKFGVDCDRIPNGVMVRDLPAGTDHVRGFGLEPDRYFLQVSRIVPEKRQLDLIRAFASARPPGWQLALVGGHGEDAYSRSVVAAAREAGVVLTGALTGEPLEQVFAHAGGFVLPSSHEGLPIALLEALSYGLPVLASDIPAHTEIGLEPGAYFRLGDVEALAAGLARLAAAPRDAAAREERRAFVSNRYDWDKIAVQTAEVYRRVAADVARKRV